MINKEEFGKFLDHTLASKDVSLVVAKDDAQFEELKSALVDREFEDLNDVWGLMELVEGEGSGFLAIDNVMEKEVYDFVAQYPTGQVEIWDKGKNESLIVSPKYNGVAILLLMTENSLEKVNEQGLELLSKVGMVYRESDN